VNVTFEHQQFQMAPSRCQFSHCGWQGEHLHRKLRHMGNIPVAIKNFLLFPFISFLLINKNDLYSLLFFCTLSDIFWHITMVFYSFCHKCLKYFFTVWLITVSWTRNAFDSHWNTSISELVHHREKHFKCISQTCVYAGPTIDGLRAHLRIAHGRYDAVFCLIGTWPTSTYFWQQCDVDPHWL